MDRKLLFIVLMTTATLTIFNYFTYKDYKKSTLPEHVQAGQSYKVPSKEDMMRPLSHNIDFVDKEVSVPEKKEHVITDLYNVTFSNHGGVIKNLAFRKRLGRTNKELETIVDVSNKEDLSFIIALDSKTPYLYKFLGKEDLVDRINITYETDTVGVTIKKVYSIYKNVHKIDLLLQIRSKSGVYPRVFIPGPLVDEVPYNTQSGFVYNKQSQSIDTVSEVKLDSAWLIPNIFGTQDKYFAHALVKDENSFVQRSYYKSSSSGRFISILEGPKVTDESYLMSFYMGPKDLNDMNAVEGKLTQLLNFGWLDKLCRLMLRLMEFLYKYLGNFGLVIIVLTIIIKLPLTPLSMKSAAVMDKYTKYQPQIARIRQKYKHDMQAQQNEIMKFYKTHNLHPAGQLLGCLPMFIDLPIMFSLYRVLGNYMDLYNAPFMLWITDLSSRDPYYILPILMGVSMLWQQSLAPIKDDKQRIMLLLLPILFTGLFANLAAGLVLYWFIRNLLAIGETYLRKAFS